MQWNPLVLNKLRRHDYFRSPPTQQKVQLHKIRNQITDKYRCSRNLTDPFPFGTHSRLFASRSTDDNSASAPPTTTSHCFAAPPFVVFVQTFSTIVDRFRYVAVCIRVSLLSHPHVQVLCVQHDCRIFRRCRTC